MYKLSTLGVVVVVVVDDGNFKLTCSNLKKIVQYRDQTLVVGQSWLHCSRH